MNHMEQVAKMLGIGLGERFTVEGQGEEFWFSERGLHMEKEYQISFRVLNEILTNSRKIKKKRWVPEKGDGYYYVRPCGEVGFIGEYDGDTFDATLVRTGNCYRSPEDVAPVMIDKWVAWYKGGPLPDQR